MDLLNELFNCISSIEYGIFNENYIDELLDNRDWEPFDTEWCRVYREIEELKKQAEYTNEIKNQQDKIRENVFMLIG